MLDGQSQSDSQTVGGEPSPQENRASSFPIVGVGASAGGLDAFKQLLRHLEIDTGMAFVLIQHLAPAHKPPIQRQSYLRQPI